MAPRKPTSWDRFWHDRFADPHEAANPDSRDFRHPRPRFWWRRRQDNRVGVQKRLHLEIRQGNLTSLFAVKEPRTFEIPNLRPACNHFPLDQLLRSSSENEVSVDVYELRETAKSCPLCQTISSYVERYGGPNLREVNVSMKVGLFVCVPKLFLSAGFPQAVIGNGIPLLPASGVGFHIALLSEWLRICDGTHDHAKSLSATLPTRVIEVMSPGNLDCLRLRKTCVGERGRYIALSHRWGEQVEQTKTLQRNVEGRFAELRFGDLPKTFQDAVYVTRKLGARFLWIDSLCIIQDDDDDWERESIRMEKVFASAYCTIAATSPADGFLQRSDEHFVRLGDPAMPAYVSQSVTNFNLDVEQEELNQRGWVFQERALSRRIIHFSAKQTYWECGFGIWSETDSKCVRPSNLLGSSNFPKPDFPKTLKSYITKSYTAVTDSESRPGRDLVLRGFDERLNQDGLDFAEYPNSSSVYKSVFAKYSTLYLTKPMDKPLAIAGLEYRLGLYYRTRSVYGILRNFFAESLLWQRSRNEFMKPLINLKSVVTSWSVGRERVPSWSWMAHEGEIRYGAMYTAGLSWTGDCHFRYKENQCLLAASIARLSPTCCFEPEETNWKVKDKTTGKLVGWIRCDHEARMDIDYLGCVSLAEGTTSWKQYAGVCWDEEVEEGGFHYALLVTPTFYGGRRSKRGYYRLGVAVIHGRYLSSTKFLHGYSKFPCLTLVF